jgi:hypothetical protein
MMRVGVYACYVVIDKNGKSLTTCKIMILSYVGIGLILTDGDKTVQKNRTSIDAMMHAEHLRRRYCLAFTQLAFFSFFCVFFIYLFILRSIRNKLANIRDLSRHLYKIAKKQKKHCDVKRTCLNGFRIFLPKRKNNDYAQISKCPKAIRFDARLCSVRRVRKRTGNRHRVSSRF